MIERPRDVQLEREITALVWRAAGLPVDPDGGPSSLDLFSDFRANPGGLYVPRDWDNEQREEAADWWNYGKWAACQWYDGYLAGDSESCRNYERTLRALVHVARGWQALHTQAS